MKASRILEEAQRTGTIWLGGEMEFPFRATPREAFERASKIAAQCGYGAALDRSASRLTISGGDIAGYVVLDWFRADGPHPLKVEVWECNAAYVPNEQAAGGAR